MTVKAGDAVMLVWACCPDGRRHIGWVGTVEEVQHVEESKCFCGYATTGQHAWITIGSRGVVPLSWLRKMPPPEAFETNESVERIYANTDA